MREGQIGPLLSPDLVPIALVHHLGDAQVATTDAQLSRRMKKRCHSLMFLLQHNVSINVIIVNS